MEISYSSFLQASSMFRSLAWMHDVYIRSPTGPVTPKENIMRLQIETFARVNIVKLYDDQGTPVKILLDGGDGGIVTLLADGQIRHGPTGPGDPGQGVGSAVVEYMQVLRRLTPWSNGALGEQLTGGKQGPLVPWVPCEVLLADMANDDAGMKSDAVAGRDPKKSVYSGSYGAAAAKYTAERCQPPLTETGKLPKVS
jgi:hypothetical protein